MTIGLTGGIGSGKSTVARIFEVLGAKVFDSDAVAKRVYFFPDVKQKVIALLGERAYSSNTEIDRAFISKVIFGNTVLLEQLNAIIHPAVAEQMAGFEKNNKGKLLVKESALLFEANLQNQVDVVVVVAADDELRIKRCMLRDNLSREQVIERMKNQWPQDKKIALAHHVIFNNETSLLIPQVIACIDQLKKAQNVS